MASRDVPKALPPVTSDPDAASRSVLEVSFFPGGKSFEMSWGRYEAMLFGTLAAAGLIMCAVEFKAKSLFPDSAPVPHLEGANPATNTPGLPAKKEDKK